MPNSDCKLTYCKLTFRTIPVTLISINFSYEPSTNI